MADTDAAKPTDVQQPDVAGNATPPSGSSRVLQDLLNNAAKVGFVCWLVAWALSCKRISSIALSSLLLAFTTIQHQADCFEQVQASLSG